MIEWMSFSAEGKCWVVDRSMYPPWVGGYNIICDGSTGKYHICTTLSLADKILEPFDKLDEAKAVYLILKAAGQIPRHH